MAKGFHSNEILQPLNFIPILFKKELYICLAEESKKRHPVSVRKFNIISSTHEMFTSTLMALTTAVNSAKSLVFTQTSKCAKVVLCKRTFIQKWLLAKPTQDLRSL